MTKIEWVRNRDGSPGETWNPIVGCSVATPGCTNCYAMKMAWRLANNPATPHYAGTVEKVKGKPVWTGKVALAPDAVLTAPLRRRKPTTYFVNSMGDLFHENVPDEWIDRIKAVEALCPQHTFIELTKRAGRMRDYMAESDRVWDIFSAVRRHINDEYRENSRFEDDETPWPWPLKNVMLGVSAERQQEADERIPLLLDTPAAIRFVSAEPLLGAIDFSPWLGYNPVYEKQEKRGVCVSSGSKWRSDDQARRNNLADSQTRMGPLEKEGGESSMQTDKSGTRQRRLPSNKDHAERSEGVCLGPSASVPSFQRSDTRGFDGEPQGREEEKQPSIKSGTGDLFGTANSCSPRFEGRPHRSERGEERDGKIDNRPSDRDPPAPIGRREVDSDSGRLRGDVPDNIKDSPRRPALDQIIVGGESGPGARVPEDFEASARSLRDQCHAASVAFFFKQMPKKAPIPDDLLIREYPRNG